MDSEETRCSDGGDVGASNPVREGRHFLKENDIQAQSYRRSKRQPHRGVRKSILGRRNTEHMT